MAREFKPGVYTSWEETHIQVENYSGFRVKKLRSAVEARRYVAKAQVNPEKVWYVLKGSRKDSVYKS